MQRVIKFSILFFFLLFLIFPLFAQEVVEEVAAPEEEVVLIGQPDEGVVTGETVSLDVDSGIITVKTDNGVKMTFSVIDEETILWKGIEDIELSDINVGDEAEVGYYTDEGGNLIASWVDVLIEEEIVPVPLEPEEKIETEMEKESQSSSEEPKE